MLYSLVLLGTTAAQAQKKMPTVTVELKLIPDSIVVEAKDDTSYIIITNGNGFLTKSSVLFRKIVDWMATDVPGDNKDNYVTIEGTSFESLSKFYRSQFKTDKEDSDEFKKKMKSAKKRAMELNGNLFRLGGYKTDSRIKAKTGSDQQTTESISENQPQPNVEKKPKNKFEGVSVPTGPQKQN